MIDIENNASTSRDEIEAAIRLDGMTDDQRSLLLYLESRAVDNCGLVAHAHMNAADFDIASEWSKDGFLRFSRIPSRLLKKANLGKTNLKNVAHVVALKPFSWLCAAIERERRASRTQSKIVIESLRHFQPTT